MYPARTRSQSSAGTIRPGRPPAGESDSDDDDDDGKAETFFDFGLGDEVGTPTAEYPERLEELLATGLRLGASDAGSVVGIADGAAADDDDDNDNGASHEFVYDGRDGLDAATTAARRAEWGLDEEPPSEKALLARYGEGLRDVLGEEAARAEDEEAGELEVESIALQDGAAQNDGQSSERSTTASFSSAQRGFTEHLSPGTASPAGSLTSSRKPSQFGRPAFLHPTVSRLRSHTRHASTSTVNTLSSLAPGAQHASGASSHFSQLSRSESSSTINSVLHPSLVAGRSGDDLGAGGSSSGRPSDDDERRARSKGAGEDDPFKWTVLQRISLALYPSASKASAKLAKLALGQLPAGVARRELLGRPTRMVAGGLVCVGMSSGFVGVWDFRGECKGWFGNEALLADAGPVTALELSSDHTYIAVGHAMGHLYLYQLSSAPQTPTRSVAPIALSAVQSGRKEGHLRGTPVLHVGFVGKRHTAVVSGDERGLAFYHSLGRVLGVDSTDVLRILGSYPDPPPPTPPPAAVAGQPAPARPKRKAPTTLFAAAPLPVDAGYPHAADAFQFSALLTPAKLVIVGLKPAPRTWFRRMRAGEGGEGTPRVGAAVWRPPATAAAAAAAPQDGAPDEPTLAFSWGASVRFVRAVRVARDGGADGFRAGSAPAGKDAVELDFVEDGWWEAKGAVLGMQWQSHSHLLLLTTEGVEALDTTTLKRAEHSTFDPALLVVSAPFAAGDVQPGGFSVYKGKAFFLTKMDVRVATVQSWTDRILMLMEAGDILGAILLTTDYYTGDFRNSLLGLPASDEERRRVVGQRLHELLQASVKYTFSEDRMMDGTHESSDGRGVDRTTLFEGLVTAAAAACLALGDLDFLFDDVYEQYQSNWIDGIFCRQLEPLVVDGRLRTVPTQVAQRLLQLHDDDGDLGGLETLIWHLDPACLDINQAIQLCRKHRLWDALIYVYNRALLDYVSPVVHLFGLVRTILQQRGSRPARVEAADPQRSPTLDQDAEELVPDAYKVFTYLAHVLAGVTYPTNEAIPEAQRSAAQASTYAFVFSGRTVTSPTTGELVLTSLTPHGHEPTYPYLRLLLQFDTESFLHALDIAFEDGFLNDDAAEAPTSRQAIVEVLLDVMASDEFSSSDGTMLHIFVARNLPKYPQFLALPRSTLHGILSALTDDLDQSTREDRELAVEYLLSAYTPEDRLGLLPRFQHAGFYRILRSIYRSERRWPSLISAYLDDPEADFDVFPCVEEVLRAASSGNAAVANDLQATVVDVVPRLADVSVRQVAALVDSFIPQAHEAALERLAPNSRQQYGYLRALVEPSPADHHLEEAVAGPHLAAPSQQLPLAARHAYVGLLCEHDPGGVVSLLRASPTGYFDLAEVARVCEAGKVPEAVVWLLDQAGHTRAAFERVSKLVDDAGASIAGRFLDKAAACQPPAHELQDLRDVNRVAVEICLTRAERRAAPTDVSLEDMWFSLLHPLLDLVHSVSTIQPATPKVPSTPTLRSLSIDDAFGFAAEPQQPTLLSSLQALVQESLSSLVVSASDTSLSFPALFKRLLDASSADDGQARGSYGEFRAILGGMLDTYKQDAEMISVTIRLLQGDVFDALALQSVAVGRGWRASLPDVPADEEQPLALPPDSTADAEPRPPRRITFKAYRSGAVERLEHEASTVVA